MSKKRIFIAINLPEEIKKELSSFREKWPNLPCRWLKKETFHITLTFIGYINEEELDKVFEVVDRVAKKHAPFSISFSRVCYGPPKEMPPRLVYARAEESKKFLDLQKYLEEELSDSKIASRSKPQAHVTLGRIKKMQWRLLEPEERPVVNLQIFLEVPVNSIEVMESHLKRTGAEYTVLKSASLAS